MSNILRFPDKGMITVDDVLKDANQMHAAGEIEHIAVIVYNKDRSMGVALSSTPLHVSVYMSKIFELEITQQVLAGRGDLP